MKIRAVAKARTGMKGLARNMLQINIGGTRINLKKNH